MLRTDKKYFDHAFMENKLLHMRTNEHFLTHDWRHNEFYTCYFGKNEGGFAQMGSICIYDWILTGKVDWTFLSHSDDEKIMCKKLEKTPEWFQNLYRETTEKYTAMVEEWFPKSKYDQNDWEEKFGENALQVIFDDSSYEEMASDEQELNAERLGVEI